MQARAYAEFCILNREVRILLHSADTGARAHGEVVHVAGGAAASFAATLLSSGCARYVDWSARLLPAGDGALAPSSALKRAEAAAQEAGRNMWKDGAGAAARSSGAGGGGGSGGGEAIAGKVVEVVSGDTLVVAPEGGGTPIRFSLARCCSAPARAQTLPCNKPQCIGLLLVCARWLWFPKGPGRWCV